MFQTLIVAAIVIAALGYVGRNFARTVRSARASRDEACGSCGCSADRAAG